MDRLVCYFKELKPEEFDLAGGKGGVLAQLYQAGYPIPNGLIIMPIAFEDESLVSFCEDSSIASFAGQFDTVLNVQTNDEVLEAVKKVYHSRWNIGVGTYKKAGRLYKLGKRLERQLGAPQDIEWSLRGNKLYLLQSRPITTLVGFNPVNGQWNDSLTGDYLWSNVNFGEAIPEVMTPLSWSVQLFVSKNYQILPGYPSSGNIGGNSFFGAYYEITSSVD